jgi:hypothetical protein
MTAADIGELTRRHQSNVKREAERMAQAGLLARMTPPRDSTGKRGRQPTVAYQLAGETRAGAAAAVATHDEIGLLRRGQELVFASAGATHVIDLMHVLAECEDAVRASWVCRSGDEYVIAFGGTDPAEPAQGLFAAFSAARVPARRATVARLAPVHEEIDGARRTARQAQRTRLARDTRDPPGFAGLARGPG